MPPVLLILIIVIGVLILIYLGASVFLLNFGIIRNNKRCNTFCDRDWVNKYVDKKYRDIVYEGATWLHDREGEEIDILSFDGLTLHAKLISPENPKGTIICCHGYRSSPYNDFCISGRYLLELGYRILLIDERSGWGSEGKYIGMGVLERFDCQKWVELMDARFPGESIFLLGVSMGSATVLMTTGLELPDTVKGVIADCGFTSPMKIFAAVMKRDYHMPPYPFMYTMRALIKLTAKYDIKYSAEDALAENKLPIFFIHGEADDFVPYEMSLDNIKACHKCKTEFLSVPGAKHAQSYLVEKDKYQQMIIEFLNTYT